MTCGINLGILLVCILQAVHLCSSLAFQKGEGSQTGHSNSPVGLSHARGRFEGSRPQDKFRQAYVVKSSSTDSRANQKLYNKPYAHTASHAYPKYSQSSRTNPKGYNKDSIYGNMSSKRNFGLSAIASGSSVSKQDSSNRHNGVLRIKPGQGGLRISKYTHSKPGSHSSKPSPLSQSSAHQPTVWKPHSGAKVPQKPGLDKSQRTQPKEHVHETSGLSRGRKVSQNGSSRKPSYPLSQSSSRASFHEMSQLPKPWPVGQQSHEGSDQHQSPRLVSHQPGIKPVSVHMRGSELLSGRLGPGKRFAPTKIHNIPQPFGGHPIKRLGNDPVVWTTTTTKMPKKQVTRRPVKTYTFPPRPTPSYKPQQQSVHQKSKWMKIRSNQLTGASGVFGQSL
ncbi:hypothetical protein WMY93_019660 [Mugilogobius chulae]|uniref:Uncharacterized protein n=1 Tax=Mugilogobius chulae TaxID=88201 RepID=A0AAW0NJH3_9GOBI